MTHLPDGSIHWGDLSEADAAPDFDIWGRHRAIYEWVRLIRGAIVSGAFSIERNFDGIISCYFLQHKRDVLQEFREGVLGSLSFDRKVTIVTDIVGNVRGRDAAKELLKEVRKFQVLRNAMAHRPFWLVPDKNSEGKIAGLTPNIKVGKSDRILDKAFAADTNELIKSLIAATGFFGSQIAHSDELGEDETPIFVFESTVGPDSADEFD